MDYIYKQLKSPALLSKTLTKKTNDKSVSDLGLKAGNKEQSETRKTLGTSIDLPSVHEIGFWDYRVLLVDGFMINLTSLIKIFTAVTLLTYINLG